MPTTHVDPPVGLRAPVGAAAPAPSLDHVVAAIGHVRRGGRWALPRRFRAVAWMGGVEIDLTEAVIPPEGADIELLAVLGVITVRVPEELAVTLIGDAITWDGPLGARRGTKCAAVRVSGRAVLGKVHVYVVPSVTRASR